VAIAFGAACQSLSGLNAPEPDGGADATIGPGDDDAAPGDDAATDGGADASLGNDAAFCNALDGSAVLCDDFENGIYDGGPWDLTVVNAGTLGVASSAAGAGNHELLVSIPALGGTAGYEADLRRSFALPGTSRATLTYRFAIDAPPGAGNVQLMNLFSMNPDGSYFTIFLLVTTTQIALSEKFFPPDAGAPTELDHPITFAFKSWHTAKLDVRLTSPPHMTFAIDGTNAFDGDTLTTLVPGKPVVSAGIRFAQAPTGPLTLHVDDITFSVFSK
jgi:hypothetical protein